MKSPKYAFLAAAIATQQSEALQTVFSRKAFVSRAATACTIVATGASFPESALAAEDPKAKAGKKAPLRGGKNMSDALHNGTDLNKGEAAVASSLLDKMGLPDITPDKGPNSRAPPKAR